MPNGSLDLLNTFLVQRHVYFLALEQAFQIKVGLAVPHENQSHVLNGLLGILSLRYRAHADSGDSGTYANGTEYYLTVFSDD